MLFGSTLTETYCSTSMLTFQRVRHPFPMQPISFSASSASQEILLCSSHHSSQHQQSSVTVQNNLVPRTELILRSKDCMFLLRVIRNMSCFLFLKHPSSFPDNKLSSLRLTLAFSELVLCVSHHNV